MGIKLGHFFNLGKDGNMNNNLTGSEFLISKHLSDAMVHLLDLLNLQFVTFIYDDNCGKNIEFSNKERCQQLFDNDKYLITRESIE